MLRNYKREAETKIGNLNNEIEEFRRRNSESMSAQTQKIA